MSEKSKTATKLLVLQLMVGDWSLFIHFHLLVQGLDWLILLRTDHLILCE